MTSSGAPGCSWMTQTQEGHSQEGNEELTQGYFLLLGLSPQQLEGSMEIPNESKCDFKVRGEI